MIKNEFAPPDSQQLQSLYNLVRPALTTSHLRNNMNTDQGKWKSGFFGSSIARPDSPTVQSLLASVEKDSPVTSDTGITYVLHHADSDGRVAGWCAWKSHVKKDPKNFRYYEVQYGEPFPIDVETLTENDIVYILDFSYSRNILDAVHAKVGYLQVLDHHPTAQKELEGAEYAIFDTTKSGALLAWEFFFGHATPPLIVTLTNDRDLWKFEYPQSRPFEAAVRFNGLCNDFRLWDKLATTQGMVGEWVAKGKLIVEIAQRQIQSHINTPGVVTLVDFDGYQTAIFNTTIHVSESGEAVYDHPQIDADLSMSYQFVENGNVVFSLRAAKSAKVDCSHIAWSYGGGGHSRAAGFKLDQPKAFELLTRLYQKKQPEVFDVVLGYSAEMKTSDIEYKIPAADIPAVLSEFNGRINKSGPIYGEHLHPVKASSSPEEFFRRCSEIDLAKTSHSILAVSYAPDNTTTGDHLVIWGKIKPTTTQAGIKLKEDLLAKRAVAFGLRGFTSPGSNRVFSVITWDLVSGK